MCARPSNVNLNLCSLLIYTPFSIRRQPPRNRCVFSFKMRLGFISTVNLHVIPADRGEIVVFSRVKCAWASFRLKIYICHPCRPRRNRCVFSCKMRLPFISNVNLHITPAHPGEIVVFSRVKCASRSFRLKIYIMALPPTPEKSLCFSMKNARCTNAPRFLMFSQVTWVVRSA